MPHHVFTYAGEEREDHDTCVHVIVCNHRFAVVGCKNMVLMEYFIQQIFASGIEKWVNYVPAKTEAMKTYQMTWNIANKTVDKMKNKKEESKIIGVK